MNSTSDSPLSPKLVKAGGTLIIFEPEPGSTATAALWESQTAPIERGPAISERPRAQP